MENLRWANTEPPMNFRETYTKSSILFRKANMDPTMNFRKVNTDFLLLVLLPTLLAVSPSNFTPVFTHSFNPKITNNLLHQNKGNVIWVSYIFFFSAAK